MISDSECGIPKRLEISFRFRTAVRDVKGRPGAYDLYLRIPTGLVEYVHTEAQSI
jgi:hypothetical protein